MTYSEHFMLLLALLFSAASFLVVLAITIALMVGIEVREVKGRENAENKSDNEKAPEGKDNGTNL